MPRKSLVAATVEEERLLIIHDHQQEMRKRLNRELKVKKAGHLPGEENFKRDMAVFLKLGVPNISYAEIANRLGETKTTVRKWFNEPETKEKYEWLARNFKEASIELLNTYSVEAVETLVLLMRYGDLQHMFKAATDILDRVGVAKVSRSEVESSSTKRHKWEDRDVLVNEIRELPLELQEEAIAGLERFEEILSKNSKNGTNNEEADENMPPAIVNIEDEEFSDDDNIDEGDIDEAVS